MRGGSLGDSRRREGGQVDAARLAGAVRRIRRSADLSQRELAEACGISQSVVARVEGGRRDLPVAVLGRMAAVAGMRLALLDGDGVEVRPMSDDAVRDMGDRRFPAHLDTRYSEEDWWHGPERYSRPEPWYTFDRRRSLRDEYRRLDGTPDDHQLPQQGDSPQDRRAARARAILERRRATLPPPEPEPWICDCPPLCAELEDWQGPPRHADECLCRCDPC
jgi:transcriptional regulator with XRE-family HTH domain